MRERPEDPTMPSPPHQFPADAAPGPFAEAVAHTEHDKERVILTRDGKPVAAIVPIEDLAALEDAEEAHWRRVADEAVGQWEAEGRPAGISHEELLARYGVTPNAA
jgi:prevent-host-death family protein